jgi:hypothetical protein
MVLSGDGMDRLAGRKVRELFREVRGEASVYEDLECLCVLCPFVIFANLMSFGAARITRSERSSAGIATVSFLPNAIRKSPNSVAAFRFCAKTEVSNSRNERQGEGNERVVIPSDRASERQESAFIRA